MSKPPRYSALSVPCDLCEVALSECATRLGPAFIYTLTVHPTQSVWVRKFLHRIAAQVVDNPFAPYVNLVDDDSLERLEWFLSDGTKAIGCNNS